MPMIKCTDEQAYLIELCLETMCRASLGQLNHFTQSLENIRGKMFEAKCPDGEVRSFYSLGKYIEEMLKPILFPELASNQSYGVGQKAIGRGQVLYEMEKVLQNYRAEKEKHPARSVTWHKPLHYSKEPLIEVIKLKDEGRMLAESKNSGNEFKRSVRKKPAVKRARMGR